LPDFEKDKYEGDKKMWEYAADKLRNVLSLGTIPYEEGIGEAAFYGPKLDIQIKNIYGKEDTIATIQIDILVAKRMKLTFTDTSGKKATPIIIHRSILGSFERFLAFYIEQTEGNFPIYFAPCQVKLISVSNKFNDKVSDLELIMKDAGIRVEADYSDESVGKKIRNAALQKIPAKIIIGEHEIQDMEDKGVWNFNVNWRQDISIESKVSLEELTLIIQKESLKYT
jgi:threonyl-tRNA synthetase